MASTSIPLTRSPAGYTAALPFCIGAAFVFLISFPGLLELPGGVPASMALMFLGLPYWFRAARLRDGPIFDPAAQAGLAIILSCNVFLIAWAFLTAIGADVPFRAGRSIASLAGAFAVYLLVLGTVTSARRDMYLMIACFTLAFTCLATFLASYQTTLRGMTWWTDRAHAFFKNPNQFAMSISTMLPVVIGYLLVQRARRLLWGLCLSLFFLGLMLSGSKMNLLLSTMTTGAMILAVAYTLNTGRRRVKMIVAGLCLYALLVMIGFFLLDALNPRAVYILTRLIDPELEVQSLQTRSSLWQHSIDQFMIDPVFGQGAGQGIPLSNGGTISHSHNIVLDFARTLGLPGLWGFLIMTTTSVILSLGAIRMAIGSGSGSSQDRILTIGLAIGTLAYLAANFSSDSMGPSTSPFFWVAFFLCLASRRPLASPA